MKQIVVLILLIIFSQILLAQKSKVELALKEWKIDLNKEYQAGTIGKIEYKVPTKKRFLSE